MSNDEERLTRMLEETVKNGSAYVIRERMGDCVVCGNRDDLRFGVCFGCADRVKGDCLHHLWVEGDASKNWFCDDSMNVIDPRDWLDLHVGDPAALKEVKP